ncbi:c-type cytochrome [Rhizobium anhuiense]|uniref:c-type cytochrome n=1 Tax=Rhizobium anhuiense TaxID=1184720 RepID=UPI001FE072D4|nr:hypothetical protein [Rhizobium anhuiense]
MKGMPTVKNTPIIAGQHESSLLIALQEYRNGERTDDLMGRIAKNLSDDDMKALAAYFSALPWPPTASRPTQRALPASERSTPGRSAPRATGRVSSDTPTLRASQIRSWTT